MTYPPQPPPPGPPGWGPPQGPPTPPPPGWGPPPGAPYGGPPRRNVGLVVALVAVLVLLVGGIATTAVLLTRGDDGDEKAADDPTSQSTASPSESATTPSGEPTPPTPPTPPSPSGPITPYAPSDDTGDDIHADVKAADFPGDWDFKLGDVEQHATLKGSWDYDSCGPVEADSTLTRQRCEYAVQWSFTALGGKARVTHLFLVFDTQPHAKAAEASLQDKDFDLRAGSLFEDFTLGKWHTSTYGNVVAVTIGTTNSAVPEKDLQSLVSYMNTDYRVALTFKGL